MPKKKKAPKTALYLTDFHVPYHNEEAIGLALEYGLSADPDEIIISEVPDCYQVSSWKKDPTRLPFLDELELSRKWIDKLAKKFKKQKVTYLVGNHDERLNNYLIKNAPELVGIKELELPFQLGIHKYNWQYIDNRKLMMAKSPPLKIGHLTFLHGHEVKTGWGAVNLAKIYYERCRTNVVVAHHHRCQEWVVRTIAGKHEGSWLLGCLCLLSPEFLPHNDWIHGFAIIRFDADGDFRVENCKIINGKVL